MGIIIVLVLVQAGILWLTIKQFGKNVLSVLIAILALINLCPWFVPYNSIEPFILGHPWWITVWLFLSVMLLFLLYIRLFHISDKHKTDILPDLWEKVRSHEKSETRENK